MKFTRYDVRKQLVIDRVDAFMQQVCMANAKSGIEYITIQTPTKHRGDKEERRIITYDSVKVKAYFRKKLKHPQSDKALIKERLAIIDRIENAS